MIRTTVAALGLVALGTALPALWTTRGATPVPELVELPSAPWVARESGTWRLDGRQVDPPLVRHEASAALAVMRHQVSRAEYAACVAAAACLPAGEGPDDEPQTGVSWHDATAYAAWLSRETGETWRLPTDAEWQRAAAERFADDALGEGGDWTDRWIATYDREAEARGEANPELRLKGGWGENSLGVADLSGNVWEWTADCVVTATLGPEGEVATRDDYCGARVVEGRHRAVVIDFIRDARSGGCATGVPPDYLGFRLVREG